MSVLVLQMKSAIYTEKNTSVAVATFTRQFYEQALWMLFKNKQT
jgi:hypothetical protein